MRRRFAQVDVFGSSPWGGNPLAVVLDGEGVPDDELQRFAAWTNLSETTFLLPPSSPDADYLVRIFTPEEELPFAGHPTLGSCHAWLEGGGVPRAAGDPDVVVQECGAGLVRVRRTDGGLLAFAAPPTFRSGPVEPELRPRVLEALGLAEDEVVDVAWAANGPRWIAVLLPSADAVLAVRPRFAELDVGVVGPHPPGGPADLELRTFFPHGTAMVEDPVTGSFNASVAQWLLASGRATAPYVGRQGTALGRSGRIEITTDAAGDVWVGGATETRISGHVEL